MPIIQPSMSEVTDITAPLPPGTYSVRITDASDGEKTIKGVTSKALKLQLQVFDDPNWNGKVLFDSVDYTGKYAFAFKKYWEAATGKTYDGKAPVNTDELLGAELKVVVIQQPSSRGDGKIFNNIREVKNINSY